MAGILSNFIIIGSQRSGTTALYAYLRTHPEVFLAPGKEVHYFDRHINRGVAWYKNRFSRVTSEDAVGEATPDYMYFGGAISRMAQVVPNARLIAILRNPVDRAYSHYWHERARGHENLEFVDAITAEPDRLAFTGEEDSAWHYRHHSYLDRGRYLTQLQWVGQFFPREALHVVLLEELCNTPLETYRGVRQFLGVEDTFISRKLGTVVYPYVSF